MDTRLLLDLMERHLGENIDSASPVQITGWAAVASLWPLNGVFRPHFDQIKSLAFQPRFEAEADEAIVNAAFAGTCDSWSSVSAGCWRVLLE